MKAFNITSMKRFLILSCAVNVVSVIIVLFVVSASAKKMKKVDFNNIRLMQSGYQVITYLGVLECIRSNDTINAMELLEFHVDLEVCNVSLFLAKTKPEVRELGLFDLRRAADYRKKYPRKIEASISNFGSSEEDYRDTVKESADILSNVTERLKTNQR